MFRRLKGAYAGLIAALNRWTAAINRHCDELEAEEVPADLPIRNGRAPQRATTKT